MAVSILLMFDVLFTSSDGVEFRSCLCVCFAFSALNHLRNDQSYTVSSGTLNSSIPYFHRQKEEHPACKNCVDMLVVMVVWLVPLPVGTSDIACCIKIQNGLTVWYRLYTGCHGILVVRSSVVVYFVCAQDRSIDCDEM